VLNLRTPLDDLHKVTPELKLKLRDLSAALERGSHRQTLSEAQNKTAKLAVDREAGLLNRFNEDWLSTVDKIRQDFLRPCRPSSLQVAAANGPVVANDHRSYCLIMSAKKVDILQLQNLTNANVRLLVNTRFQRGRRLPKTKLERKIPEEVDPWR
jgi:hypothetical protein